MKSWYTEDWHFKIEVLKVGKENKATECRSGLEPGDTFECDYGTPLGLRPTVFIKIFPTMEAIRCEGDLRYLGAQTGQEMDFMCPDGVVRFRITGSKQE